MRKLLGPIFALALAMPLGGCFLTALDPGGTSLLQGGTSVTATITQPIGLDQMYIIESTYGVAERTLLAYMRMRQCRASERESLANPCSRRSVKVRLQALDQRAYGLLVKLRTFRMNNDTISAISIANQLRAVLLDYQNEITVVANVVGVK